MAKGNWISANVMHTDRKSNNCFMIIPKHDRVPSEKRKSQGTEINNSSRFVPSNNVSSWEN